MTSRECLRSAWISLVDFDVEDAPNIGFEIAWGGAPPGAVRAVVRSGDGELAVPVHDGSFARA